MAATNKKDTLRHSASADVLLGQNLGFGAAEAYKFLRTNLDFSLPTEEGCKIIGVTSSLRGEGKSTTSINLAYTMSQAGYKVLLLEADMRLPNIAKRLHIKTAPGLSNLLAGRCGATETIQKSSLISGLWVISAGDIPPNPAELLNSNRMETVIKALADAFDVVIVDLPPVMAVSDAIIVSRMTDGLVLVVRQEYCNRASLNESVRRMKLANAKVLGFVMTNATYQDKRYGNSKYYRNTKDVLD